MAHESTLHKTPLYESHLKLGARIVPFGGWYMPVQYQGILSEYEQTREKAALFDTSHMGEFRISGGLEETGLDRVVTMRLSDLPVGHCRYGFILNDDGGVMDDLIVFREDADRWFIVVNGVTTEKDAAHFRRNLNDGSCFEDISAATGKIDLQGPLSRTVITRFVPEVESLLYYTFGNFSFCGEQVMISRTGYTGELGYEIYCPSGATEKIWNALIAEKETAPAGLGARDMLRLEAGYSLYGHELAEDITPLEAGLGKFVDFEKDFIGKAALEAQRSTGPARKIVAVESASRKSPREGVGIFDAGRKEIGIITSGVFSPHLNKGIGLGYVTTGEATKGAAVFFGKSNNFELAVIRDRMFYKQGSVKN